MGQDYHDRDALSNPLLSLGQGGELLLIQERLAAESKRLSEAKYRSLFDSIDQAFCVIEMIRDAADRPVDYRFVEVNCAMEKHTGWQKPVGRRVS